MMMDDEYIYDKGGEHGKKSNMDYLDLDVTLVDL